jgi:hypothetical protein
MLIPGRWPFDAPGTETGRIELDGLFFLVSSEGAVAAPLGPALVEKLRLDGAVDMEPFAQLFESGPRQVQPDGLVQLGRLETSVDLLDSSNNDLDRSWGLGLEDFPKTFSLFRAV